MRLSDLLGKPVLGIADRSFGTVTDVRMSQGGPTVGSFGSSYKIDGLIVSHHQIFGRLGYDRVEMKGPWMLRAITKYLQRTAIFIPWTRVVAWDQQKVTIDGARDEFSAPPMLGTSA